MVILSSKNNVVSNTSLTDPLMLVATTKQNMEKIIIDR
jgi:hypothetical protein